MASEGTRIAVKRHEVTDLLVGLRRHGGGPSQIKGEGVKNKIEGISSRQECDKWRGCQMRWPGKLEKKRGPAPTVRSPHQCVVAPRLINQRVCSYLVTVR